MVTAATARTMILTEEFIFERKMAVDRERNVVPDVRLVTRKSKNKREYLDEATGNAIPMYEGAKVNVNHGEKPGSPRDYRDRIGRIRNVRKAVDEVGGLIGDFHYNPKHPLIDQFLWDAENDPTNCGFSHNVLARCDYRGSTLVVEEITKVISVDIVGDPGSTDGLKEYEEFDMAAVKTVKKSVKVLITEGTGGEAGFFETAAKAQGIDLAREFEVAESDKPAIQLVAVLEACGVEVMRDAAKPIAERAEKLRLITQLADDCRSGAKPVAENYRVGSASPAATATAASGAAAAGASDPALAQVLEAVKGISGRLDTLDKKQLAESILEKNGISKTVALIETLAAMPSKEAMELHCLTQLSGPSRLQEGWQPSPQPKSGDYTAPKSAKELMERVTNPRF